MYNKYVIFTWHIFQIIIFQKINNITGYEDYNNGVGIPT